MNYTQEQTEKAMALLEDIRNILRYSHRSSNQKIKKIFDLFDEYDPEEKMWDVLHRKVG